MHRLLCYDETIRDNYMYNLNVFVEDEDVRPGIVSYLDGLGYDLGTSVVLIGGNKVLASVGNKLKEAYVQIPHIDYEQLSMNPIIHTYHGTIGIGACTDRKPIDTWTERTIKDMHESHEQILENYEKWISDPERSEEEREMDKRILEQHKKTIICDNNTELFKILAAYRNDNDYGKIIYYKDPDPRWWKSHNVDGELHSEKDQFWINTQWEDFSKCDVQWVKERCILLNNYEDIIKYMKF